MWAVFLGERLVPMQLQAEWIEYKLMFDDILKRLSAQLARQAKEHKRSVQAVLEESPPPAHDVPGVRGLGPSMSSLGRKAELYRKFTEQRGVPPNGAPVPEPEEIPS